jgi:3-methyladenine DNA glycosylase AlkD
MARYGIVATTSFGVSMGTMRSLAKRLGRDHDLAVALWETGWHEASDDAPFLGALALIERAAIDDRNFVKKGVNWAQQRHPERSEGSG